MSVNLQGVTKTYGTVVALNNFNLDIAPGELVALLGPSGCGKTTALRILAGLDTQHSGQILVDGKDIVGVPANKRNMGMVFQAYSLFPTMTVLENIAYGMRVRHISKEKQVARANELLELVGLQETGKRLSHQLSGGQQQRVALARALAIEPSVLLLDEPLSALDAQVRTQLRDEIKRIQTEVGTTTLFVTHDQEEAMAIADRVGVMRHGVLEQCASPQAVYLNPINVSVAKFVGAMNLLPAVVTTNNELEIYGQSVGWRNPDGLTARSGRALVRPEQLLLGSPTTDRPANAIVTNQTFLGPLTRISAKVMSDGNTLHVEMPSIEASDYPIGKNVVVTIQATSVLLDA
ncbi:MAG: ATP-binding cassette domain-containing protein [Actinobacteria bacterium]|nr:ATP-binding cassette domain-containing protein [Actinomycetota bacterium]MSX89976.1 ATP-binding cassette domain-containing protein [Actinomycetota bacterium]MSZ64581.1 ATP-binding cassette domain-containing protein [Actinomycetota bacterium]MTA57581.1 ATP-binding cassette domain-containing protein [Actinomycetota bacterium]